MLMLFCWFIFTTEKTFDIVYKMNISCYILSSSC
jgi:hypothetical protein